jgi:hypothetical protein
MSTRLFALAGTPDQVSGGELFCPWQVYSRGISPSSWNAGEFRVIICFTAIKGWRTVACERLLLPSAEESDVLLVGSHQLSVRTIRRLQYRRESR